MMPTISINVDTCNPGQVFACMGLFELAACLADKQTQPCAWFEELRVPHTRFHIEAYRENCEPVTLEDIVSALKDCTVEEMEYNDKEGPVRLGEPFELIIDWRSPYPRNRSAKTWAGRQDLTPILRDLLCHLSESPSNDLLVSSCTTDKTVTCFNASQSMGALDVGFSHDKLQLYELSVFPPCELLCLIGLQRSCPGEAGRYSRRYALWDSPLSLNAAALVTSTAVTMQSTAVYTFEMFKRSPDGRYKAFAPARPATP